MEIIKVTGRNYKELVSKTQEQELRPLPFEKVVKYFAAKTQKFNYRYHFRDEYAEREDTNIMLQLRNEVCIFPEIALQVPKHVLSPTGGTYIDKKPRVSELEFPTGKYERKLEERIRRGEKDVLFVPFIWNDSFMGDGILNHPIIKSLGGDGGANALLNLSMAHAHARVDIGNFDIKKPLLGCISLSSVWYDAHDATIFIQLNENPRDFWSKDPLQSARYMLAEKE